MWCPFFYHKVTSILVASQGRENDPFSIYSRKYLWEQQCFVRIHQPRVQIRSHPFHTHVGPTYRPTWWGPRVCEKGVVGTVSGRWMCMQEEFDWICDRLGPKRY